MTDFIELDNSEDHTLYEYENCRFTISKQKPLHICAVGFKDSTPTAPYDEDLNVIINYFFVQPGLAYIKIKGFEETAIHLYEKTEFTQKLAQNS